MRDDDLLTIGEVARLDGVSTKALRYYDAHGILRPLVTDPRTGYRYYAPDQMIAMDVIRLCLDAGMPLDSIASFRAKDGTLDWRALMETGRTRVAADIARLRALEVSLDDYLGEITRKARTPDDGVVRSTLPPSWMVGSPWERADAFDTAAYLRAMADLREATRAAGLPRLLRRGILVDPSDGRTYAYQQFEPSCGGDRAGDDAAAARFDTPFTVFHPSGGEARGVVIERETLGACIDEAFNAIGRERSDGWRHATICEIWGSHDAHGAMRVRLTFHHCDAGRVARDRLR